MRKDGSGNLKNPERRISEGLAAFLRRQKRASRPSRPKTTAKPVTNRTICIPRQIVG
jgi:hypothetical protein